MVTHGNHRVIAKGIFRLIENILPLNADRSAGLNCGIAAAAVKTHHIAPLHRRPRIDIIIQLFLVGKKVVVPLFGLRRIELLTLLQGMFAQFIKPRLILDA